MSPNKRFVERLDPRTKFFTLFMLALVMFSFSSPLPIAAAGIVLVAGVSASGASAATLIARARYVSWFLIVITIANLFTVSGNTLFEFSGLYATREGLIDGLTLSARILLLFWLALLYIATTTMSETMDGIEGTLRPFRRRFGPLILMLNMTANFVPLLIRTAQQIKVAQTARGADIRSQFVHQIRFAFSAALPLFASAFRASEHVSLAMEARCYDPSVDRTEFSKIEMRYYDWFTLLGVAFLAGAAIFMPR